MVKVSTRDAHAIANAISTARDFECYGSLSGKAGDPVRVGYNYGRMDRSLIDSLRSAHYVIYSYSTPIAWRTVDGWVVPDDKFSVTTSKHQSTVRYAISMVEA